MSERSQNNSETNRGPGGRRLRGLYLVTDPILQHGSGAHQHIEVGVSELGKYFEINALILSDVLSNSPKAPTQKPRRRLSALRESRAAGTIKDCLAYIKNAKKRRSIVSAIEGGNYDFVYERASYLNFWGLNAAKRLRIPHFYEVNDIQYIDRGSYYKSFATPISSRMEVSAYKKSDHVFFLGTWGDYLSLPTNNWENIENGIERSFVERFRGHAKRVGLPLNVCFIGHLMPHHRLELLVQACGLLKDPSRFEFHLIGNGLNRLGDDLARRVAVVVHGRLSRAELAEQLDRMHIGLAIRSSNYATGMKIFDYGAAKLLVLATNTHNARNWFAMDELFLVDRESPAALAAALDKIATEPDLIGEYGEKLYRKVYEKFVWDDIFGHIADVIRARV